ncbi:G protein-coupled receptor 125 [Mytilus galloprovincialis]|uniref:G protein-coupled receptor 125 n=1 Tax=Mytilus galloprovincialis TaxID=29158 RepID=A0A8B6CYH3_MYTGA|nr:G protein-coupled receptor 125 [Mytilus galloprovincialis]
MAGTRAPKQWSLSKVETITSFEDWRQNLQYTLSLDQNFAAFLVDGFTWLKKTNANPLRGIVDDGEAVAEANRRTAAQKCTHLDLMLGQIANYCPIISRNTIIKNSTSINSIWQSIRLHYGFQSTGGHFLDFNSIFLEPDERPEDLFQRLASFIEDNMLRAGGNIHHHGEVPEADEELSPSLENLIVLTWLRLINRDLPNLVKQRYGTELRSKTLASLKPEISQALDSLLDEIHSATDAKVLRASIKDKHFDRSAKKTGSIRTGRQIKCCILCKQAGRPSQHFLSTCKYLPDEDKQYMSRVRQSYCTEVGDSESEDNVDIMNKSHF